MTRVTQTRTGENGNCFAACLASIFDLPMESIPDFEVTEPGWLGRVAEFLELLDLYYVQVDTDDAMLAEMFRYGRTYTLMIGVSPRGGLHAVVALNGEMVHDPHPQDGTGRGLVKVECYGLLCSRFK